MNIHKDVENQLKPKDFVKPKMIFERYYLDWAKPSYGIRATEEKELKHFIIDAIPILEHFIKAIRSLEKTAATSRSLDTWQLVDNSFTPLMKLHRICKQPYSQDVCFIIEFASDGIIFIDREEDIFVPHDDSDGLYHSQLHIRWSLGSLIRKSHTSN